MKNKAAPAFQQALFLLIVVGVSFSCQKNSSEPKPQRIITDTLLIYSQKLANGKSLIKSKSYKTGETVILTSDASSSFATDVRVVYIKSGTILGYARLDGISKLLDTLTQPNYPCLSVDSRLICVVDKSMDKYQLLIYDTLGNKTPLFENDNEIITPSFTSDGQKIVFAQKVKDSSSSSLFIIQVTGGTPQRITPSIPDSYDENCTVTNQTVYFTRSHFIHDTLSSEILSSDFSGSLITPLTNYTNNWTTPSFFIKDLRKVNNFLDSSSFVLVSNYNNLNSEIFSYAIGGNLTRITETDEIESFPNLIPNYLHK